MKKDYCFAGIGLQIDIPDRWMYEDDGILAPFRVVSVSEPYVFRFEMIPELLPPEGECVVKTDALRVYEDGTRYIGAVEHAWQKAYAQVIREDRHFRVLLRESQFHGPLETMTVLNVLGVERLVPQTGGFLFHSSYIEVNGTAILFTAPSETGKSTQADLWAKLRGAEIINGDRSAVRVEETGIFACGIPFAGSSAICKNKTLPLKAIVYLKQAPVTTIRRLGGAEAFRRMWEGCNVNIWDKKDVEAVSKAVEQVILNIPVFELACTPDESAVCALEGAMNL